jgi:hypothetical protein
MKNKNELTVEDNSHATESETSPEPFLRFVYKKDPDTGRKSINTAELSNGVCSKDPEFLGEVLKALKRATGSNNPEVAERILSDIAWGMSSSDSEERMSVVNALLPSLGPLDESEALLLGQFLALRDSGMQCLRRANDAEMLYQVKELSHLSVKLMRCANETIQTLLKYRSGGKQQIQVVHVSGEGKAIIANEMNLKEGG